MSSAAAVIVAFRVNLLRDQNVLIFPFFLYLRGIGTFHVK